MEGKKFPKNLVMFEGEITRIFEKRSEKAPVNFFFMVKETREIERNGIKEDIKTTLRSKGYSFNFPADLTVGDVVQMYGTLVRDHYKTKDGEDKYEDRFKFFKFNKIGHNESEDENIPDDIPEGEINFDDIPF